MSKIKKIILALAGTALFLGAPVIPEGNGIISVVVFEDLISGEEVYVQIPDSQYNDMGKVGGYLHNPIKEGSRMKWAYQNYANEYKDFVIEKTATSTHERANPQPRFTDRDDLISIFEYITPKAEAALAFDKSATQYANATLSITISLAASESDSIAMIFTLSGGGDRFSSLKVDGVNASQIDTIQLCCGGAQALGAFYFLNPSTSAVNYVLTFINTADDGEIGIIVLKDAKQSGQPDSFNFASGSSPVTSTTNVVAENSWLTTSCRNNLGACTASTGVTLREAGTSLGTGDSDGTVPTGNQGMTWTRSSSLMGVWNVSVAAAVAVIVDIPILQEMIIFSD